ncbi:(uracil-5)-methyltransferase [Hyphomicrobium denitrificans 1NES1]|uniref:(Uracil-5)-methyltransferase n=1 Tax=Hyphomicrobium denitrificans 1NES1 TaxID=670307 RepID=N0B1Q1_9HYPH|nr:class I SAM-dependent RNA methyltransferase [Hyphomicrobium denitrificans]AGK57409.1 (uracil-5)-methyltransferase [Hyphomicrobium denitrificans 1NES1]
MSDERELLITRVGAQGDGFAESEGAPVFVPFALAGERVIADVDGERGRLLRVLQPSAERIAPICRHFGTCGGCAVQHMSSDAYRAWKRGLVASAFAARGLDVDVDELVEPGGKRRRAVFSIERDDRGVVIGFHEAQSHVLVAIDECPVLEPKIVAALPALNALVAPLISKRGARLTVTLTNSGLDVLLDGIERRLTPDIRSRLASGASTLQLARLAVGNDVVVETLPPFLSFATADVVLPPGCFVQAVAEAEIEMARRILTAVGKVKTVADLFCGIGAFTLPLAARAKVLAFDGNQLAIEALRAAAKKATGLKPITARVRDLFREPLSPLELNEHDAVVFDPPRAGAEAQAQRLARSKVKTVVAVSCNPATLARDARQLVDGGYKIEFVTPVDQFVYSAHVEVVAVFRR